MQINENSRILKPVATEIMNSTDEVNNKVDSAEERNRELKRGQKRGTRWRHRETEE